MLVRLTESLVKIDERLAKLDYWTSGAWMGNEWAYFKKWLASGQANEPFMIASVVCIWLIMFGADWPKKWLYWGWVVFWVLRAVTL